MYQALYRKYRPQKFKDVYGQDVVIKTLENAITHHQIGHAYMFSGPRGTGKTTIAKILARAVNCLTPVDGETCGKCENCLNSFSKECIDIIEIDAASNNGVDEIRELKNKVNIVPSELKYKIYIIDEVHMLSIGAFNALLKTLEEPPEHIIFILATTDPQKVPITIISRCQCYNFKRIDDISMKNRLQNIAELENFEIEPSVLDEIVYASDGGLRDAIGLLDKIASYKSGLITLNDFYDVNGTLMKSDLTNLVDAIFSNEPKQIIQLIEQFSQNGKDLTQITKQILYFLKDKLLQFYTEEEPLEYNEEQVIELVNNINERMFDIKQAGDVKTYIEIFFLNFVHNSFEKRQEKVENTPKMPEKKEITEKEVIEAPSKLNSSPLEIKKSMDNMDLTNTNTQDFPKIDHNIEKNMDLMRIQAHNILATASKTQLLQVKESWNKLEDFTFDSHIGYVVCYLMDGTLRAANEQSFILSYEYEAMIEKVLPSLEKMVETFSKITTLDKKITLITDAQWNSLREEFIQCKQKGVPFEILEEKIAEEVMESEKSISSEEITKDSLLEEEKTLALFGDIVEIN